jgi:hypothetical protein
VEEAEEITLSRLGMSEMAALIREQNELEVRKQRAAEYQSWSDVAERTERLLMQNLADIVFQPSPLFQHLTYSQGVTYDGGRRIQHPLIYNVGS